jgi:hypothetical protein
MVSFTHGGHHRRLPQDFWLGIAATVALAAVLWLLLALAASLPARGPVAEPRGPGVTVEAGPQSPAPAPTVQ